MTPELSTPSVGVLGALEKRRAAAVASEVPRHWLLDSPKLTVLVSLARQVASVATTPVIIQGERGCGVRELARVVHDNDACAMGGSFRTVPAQFLGPAETRTGASHGTLLVEDVEHLKPAGQAWVARILAERASANGPLRIIASSRYSVSQLLLHTALNQELVHALDVSRLIIPPLRQRPDEILGMARKLVSHYSARLGRPSLRLTPDAECKLMAHGYPANVCELRNVVERAVALSAAGEVEIGDAAIVFYDEPNDTRAGSHCLSWRSAAYGQAGGRLPSLVEMERDYLVMLIRQLRGRRTEISRAMGVSYPTVLKKIAQHRLDVRAIVAAEPEVGPWG